jgi:hypothetical protein
MVPRNDTLSTQKGRVTAGQSLFSSQRRMRDFEPART